MNYSRRLTWHTQPNALSQERRAFERSGRRLIDLTVSNPTRAGITYPNDLLAALSDPRALLYEPEAAGSWSVREAIAEYYASHGATVHPERILVTASTSEAYHYLFKLLTNPGEEILVPRPSYPLFDFLAGLEYLSAIPYPIHSADPCNLVTHLTRALVAVHPNNPTGEYLSTARSRLLAERCATLGLALLVDEVFLDYRLDGGAVESLATSDAESVFILSGLSKVCGLPQMKLGWLVMPVGVPQQVREGLELIADTYLSVSAPVQWASVSWLRRRQELQAPILERILVNSRIIQEAGLGYRAPEGGWTAVMELPELPPEIGEEHLALTVLRKDGVLVQPGYFYDYSRGNRLVVSLLTPPEDLRQGIESLVCAIGLAN